MNFALKCPWFVCREQIMRLITLRRKCSIDTAKKFKLEAGVPLTVMRDIAVVDGKSLSLRKVVTFKLADCQGTNTLMSFVN
jgi:hypothetical protein